MIGVTGTNGKTTVTQLLGDLLGATGRPTNVMGTLSGARTTPEATEVQRVLAGVRDRQKSDGARHAVAMEVSSHALVQSRVEGIHFDVAVFTNLSHDHLDYHGTMEDVLRGEGDALHAEPRAARRGQRRRPLGSAAPRARPASRPSPCTTPTPPTSCCAPATPSSPGAGSGSRTPLTGAINVDNALLAAEAALALEELELGPEDIARAMAPPAARSRAGSRSSPRPAPRATGRRRRSSPRAPLLHRARRLRPHAGRPRGGARRGADAWRPAGGCSASSGAAGTGTGPSGP